MHPYRQAERLSLPKKVNGKRDQTKGMEPKGKGPTQETEKAFLQTLLIGSIMFSLFHRKARSTPGRPAPMESTSPAGLTSPQSAKSLLGTPADKNYWSRFGSALQSHALNLKSSTSAPSTDSLSSSSCYPRPKVIITLTLVECLTMAWKSSPTPLSCDKPTYSPPVPNQKCR